MNRFAEIVLGDGMLCLCPFEESEVPKFGTICVVSIDGFSEFGRFLRVCKFSREGHVSYSGAFLNVAGEAVLARLTGNEEALSRVRGVLMKWVSEERRTLYALRMRFTMRRERLYLTLDATDTTHFQSLFDVLEKRFQTHICVQFLSSRALCCAIGGVGVCGCRLCCSNGICEQSRVDMKMAKQQLMSVHDGFAAGVCGRLKCCIAFEA